MRACLSVVNHNPRYVRFYARPSPKFRRGSEKKKSLDEAGTSWHEILKEAKQLDLSPKDHSTTSASPRPNSTFFPGLLIFNSCSVGVEFKYDLSRGGKPQASGVSEKFSMKPPRSASFCAHYFTEGIPWSRIMTIRRERVKPEAVLERILNGGRRKIIDLVPPGRIPAETRRVSVVSYNILADSHQDGLNLSHLKYFSFEERQVLVLEELLAYDSDIICLQECERELFSSFYQPQLALSGYQGLYHSRGDAIAFKDVMPDQREWIETRLDGCAIFWKKKKFTLRAEKKKELRQSVHANGKKKFGMGDVWLLRQYSLYNNIVSLVHLELNALTPDEKLSPDRNLISFLSLTLLNFRISSLCCQHPHLF